MAAVASQILDGGRVEEKEEHEGKENGEHIPAVEHPHLVVPSPRMRGLTRLENTKTNAYSGSANKLCAACQSSNSGHSDSWIT